MFLVHVKVKSSWILGNILVGLRLSYFHEGLVNVPVGVADSSFFEEARIVDVEVVSVSEGVDSTSDTKSHS